MIIDLNAKAKTIQLLEKSITLRLGERETFFVQNIKHKRKTKKNGTFTSKKTPMSKGISNKLKGNNLQNI